MSVGSVHGGSMWTDTSYVYRNSQLERERSAAVEAMQAQNNTEMQRAAGRREELYLQHREKVLRVVSAVDTAGTRLNTFA